MPTCVKLTCESWFFGYNVETKEQFSFGKSNLEVNASLACITKQVQLTQAFIPLSGFPYPNTWNQAKRSHKGGSQLGKDVM